MFCEGRITVFFFFFFNMHVSVLHNEKQRSVDVLIHQQSVERGLGGRELSNETQQVLYTYRNRERERVGELQTISNEAQHTHRVPQNTARRAATESESKKKETTSPQKKRL